MIVPFECKSERVFSEIPLVDPRVRAILLDAAHFLAARGCALVVTCLLRTREEQKAVFELAAKLGRKEPERSPHEFGRAADIRTRGISDEVVSELVEYINSKYPYDASTTSTGSGQAGSAQAVRRSAIRHDVGGGDHVHVQVGWRTAGKWGMEPFQSISSETQL